MTINIIHKKSKNKKLINELRLISETLFLILKNQTKMANQLDAISADLDTANTKIDNITADVTNLDAQIAALSDAPTPAEIAEVKAKSAAIVDRLTSVDDMTPEAPVTPPDGDGGGEPPVEP